MGRALQGMSEHVSSQKEWELLLWGAGPQHAPHGGDWLVHVGGWAANSNPRGVCSNQMDKPKTQTTAHPSDLAPTRITRQPRWVASHRRTDACTATSGTAHTPPAGSATHCRNKGHSRSASGSCPAVTCCRAAAAAEARWGNPKRWKMKSCGACIHHCARRFFDDWVFLSGLGMVWGHRSHLYHLFACITHVQVSNTCIHRTRTNEHNKNIFCESELEFSGGQLLC